MKFTYTATREDEEQMIKYIIRRQFGFSSRFLRQLKIEGGVTLDGKETKLFMNPKAGQTIGVNVPEEHSNFEPENIPLYVAYEDEDMLIINKQPGIVVHPTKNHQAGTLANAVAYYMEKQGKIFKIRFVNRLDRDTSGLVIVAKNAVVQGDLVKQMRINAVRKTYVAVVNGIVAYDSGRIDLPIGRPADDNIRRAVTEDGDQSVTNYKVLERFDTKQGQYTYIELSLETGRTHQIRVHLSHLGHPIVGDTLYGAEEGSLLIKRQALHGRELAFRHPVTGVEVIVTSKVPEDVQELLRQLD